MDIAQRQVLLSTLACSQLDDIQTHWSHCLDEFDYVVLRQPQAGMVMAVARSDAQGEPFNLGEVTVTRCAIRLSSGETGIGYLQGVNNQHALTMALIDAVAQRDADYSVIETHLIQPLQQILAAKRESVQQATESTRVDFMTMVRGDD